MEAKALCSYAKKYKIELSECQSQLLLEDMAKVLDINTKHNLTSITEETPFVDKHLIDSLLCDLSHLPKGSKLLDVGTGGGFPGIPLAVLYPEIRFTLMDATEKKIRMVQEIAAALGLNNVETIVGRAEIFGRDPLYREKFDVVVSRGVAAYRILAELCLPFVKTKGCFYSWKGPKYEEELLEAEKALTCLNAEITGIKKELLLKTDEVHVIIECRKNKPMPGTYPRHYGTIKKKPL